MARPRRTIESLSARMRRFGEMECRGYADRYEALSYRIAGDDDILALCVDAEPGQPPPNLLFAAVHYLVLDDAEATGRLYRGPDHDVAFASFRDVALSSAERVRELVSTERVQTNSVGRSAAIAIGLASARDWIGTDPVALVEVGTSAGLNLILDRYRIDFGPNGAIGPAAASVVVRTELRGQPPTLPDRVPTIGSRLGLDIRPLDLRGDHARRWLRALVWPEHPERQALQDAAIAVFLTDPPELRACDATETLAAVLAERPVGHSLVVVHTSMAHQLTTEQRASFAAELEAGSRSRPVVRIAVENHGERWNDLEISLHRGAKTSRRRLARVQPHGRWIGF